MSILKVSSALRWTLYTTKAMDVYRCLFPWKPFHAYGEHQDAGCNTTNA